MEAGSYKRFQAVEEWNVTQQDAWEDAVKNTFCMAPPRIYIWEKLLFNPYYKGEDFMGDEIYWLNQKRAIIGLCLSTTVRTNGAVAVFLPGGGRTAGRSFE